MVGIVPTGQLKIDAMHWVKREEPVATVLVPEGQRVQLSRLHPFNPTLYRPKGQGMDADAPSGA